MTSPKAKQGLYFLVFKTPVRIALVFCPSFGSVDESAIQIDGDFESCLLNLMVSCYVSGYTLLMYRA